MEVTPPSPPQEMHEKPDVPYFDHTDDYPCIELAVHAPVRSMGRQSGLALFHTTSQGEAWSPWAVRIAVRS